MDKLFFLKVVEMASSKRELEKKIEELDDEVEEQAEQIQLLEHVWGKAPFIQYVTSVGLLKAVCFVSRRS
jgi:hypothetical protein